MLTENHSDQRPPRACLPQEQTVASVDPMTEQARDSSDEGETGYALRLQSCVFI